MRHMKDEFESSAAPVFRLLGHSLSVVFGFCGLALISLIPLGMIKILIWLGLEQLAAPLHFLEGLLLFVDIALFALVFLSGVAVFAAEILAAAKRRITDSWKDKDHVD